LTQFTIYFYFFYCSNIFFQPIIVIPSLERVVRQFLQIPREFMRTQYAEVPEFGTRELVRGSLPFARIMLLITCSQTFLLQRR